MIEDELHKLLVFNPRFVDKNESEVPPSIQKEVIYSFGAVFGEFYRNDNFNVPDSFKERQEYWLAVWLALTGETHFGEYEEENIDHFGVRGGSEVFDEVTLKQIKSDLLAIEANMVASLSYALRDDTKYKITRLFIGEFTREAVLLAHYRIQARIVDWCRANPELTYFGEKVDGKFAEAYHQIVTAT